MTMVIWRLELKSCLVQLVTGAVMATGTKSDQVIMAGKCMRSIHSAMASVIKDFTARQPLQHHGNTHAATRMCFVQLEAVHRPQ